MLLIFNKPHGVLSQFTEEVPGQRTLGAFGFPARVVPVGRFDADSEGMLLLCDEPKVNSRLLDPQNAHWRRYWAQVDGVPGAEQIEALGAGVMIQGEQTLPLMVPLSLAVDHHLRTKSRFPKLSLALNSYERMI